MTKEDTEMKVKLPRILVATAFIVTLVALGALEVLTARLPVDQDPTGTVSREIEAMAPGRDLANAQGPLSSLDYPTAAQAASDERAQGQGMEARGGQFLR
jgi:hypothetical protein